MIDAIPAVVRIMMIFVLILLAIKRNWSQGSAFIAGSTALGLIFGLSLPAVARSAGVALLHPKTLTQRRQQRPVAALHSPHQGSLSWLQSPSARVRLLRHSHGGAR